MSSVGIYFFVGLVCGFIACYQAVANGYFKIKRNKNKTKFDWEE